jgi:hypothetical protein
MQALASAGALDPEPRRGGERRWARQRRADPLSVSLRGRARAPQRLQHVGTVHVQFALLEEYGRAFDRELYRPATFCNELFARLPTAPGPGGALELVGRRSGAHSTRSGLRLAVA